jgi:hypothetical protein
MVETPEPGVADVEAAIVELLRDEAIGALATVGPAGAPGAVAVAKDRHLHCGPQARGRARAA